jgi:serine/threonine-protein kinase
MLDKGTLVKRLCAAVGLAHPSLVPMLEAGVIGEFVYCVMPFVEGASLRDRLEQEHQLSITEVVAMARALAGALAFGHAHRILHLDIRPKHILTGPPVPRLSEVGIASAVRATLAIAGQRTGLTLGAPAYMSPEQAAGQPDLDARSDLFSLGCVLYEALIGEPPLAAATPQALMLRRLTESVAPLRGLRDTVPRWLEAIILRLLARTPADRFASANELLTALDSADVDGVATQFPVRIRVAPEGPPLRSAP